MTATLERESTTTTTPAGRPRKKRFQGWIVTGVTGLVLFVFLLPLAYMAVTSLKSEQMLTDFEGPILPQSAATFEHEGEQLDIYTVPMPDGTGTRAGDAPAGAADITIHRPRRPVRRAHRVGGQLEVARAQPTRSTRNGRTTAKPGT